MTPALSQTDSTELDLSFFTGYVTSALRELKDVIRVDVNVKDDSGKYDVSITYLSHNDQPRVQQYLVTDVQKLVEAIKETYSTLRENNDERHHSYLHGVAVEMMLNKLFRPR